MVVGEMMIILTTMTMMMKMTLVAMPRQHQGMNESSKTGIIITMLPGMAVIGIMTTTTTMRERMAMMTTTLLKELAMLPLVVVGVRCVDL